MQDFEGLAAPHGAVIRNIHLVAVAVGVGPQGMLSFFRTAGNHESHVVAACQIVQMVQESNSGCFEMHRIRHIIASPGCIHPFRAAPFAQVAFTEISAPGIGLFGGNGIVDQRRIFTGSPGANPIRRIGGSRITGSLMGRSRRTYPVSKGYSPPHHTGSRSRNGNSQRRKNNSSQNEFIHAARTSPNVKNKNYRFNYTLFSIFPQGEGQHGEVRFARCAHFKMSKQACRRSFTIYRLTFLIP